MTSSKQSIQVTFKGGKVSIRQHYKAKEIHLTTKGWEKLISLEKTVTGYSEKRKLGKWPLDENWYVHTTLYTFPKKQLAQTAEENEEVYLIHIRKWYFFNDKHRPSKEGITLNVKSWQSLKDQMLTDHEKNQWEDDIYGQDDYDDDCVVLAVLEDSEEKPQKITARVCEPKLSKDQSKSQIKETIQNVTDNDNDDCALLAVLKEVEDKTERLKTNLANRKQVKEQKKAQKRRNVNTQDEVCSRPKIR